MVRNFGKCVFVARQGLGRVACNKLISLLFRVLSAVLILVCILSGSLYASYFYNMRKKRGQPFKIEEKNGKIISYLQFVGWISQMNLLVSESNLGSAEPIDINYDDHF